MFQQEPLFMPQSDWKPPSFLPALSHKKIIAIDTETRDPNLFKKGPGFLRNDAEIKGFSIATDDEAWFFPLFYTEDNYHDPAAAIAWLKDICASEQEKVFHNAIYDIEVLDSIGINVGGIWHDTMAAESILQEQDSVSLDATLNRQLGTEKDEALLLEAGASFGLDPKSEMYLLPARFVGPYGEQDSRNLIALLETQKKQLHEHGLLRVYELETRLLKVVWAMRKHGVRVDLERAHQLDRDWTKARDNKLRIIRTHVPFDVDIWKPKSLEMLCSHLKIPIKRTAVGNPSFENEWFINHDHPVMEHIAAARKYDKMRRDFLHGQIFEYEHNGRIHAQFHALRRDDGGTRSGRFSSSNPNLQQVPARDPIFGPAIRGLYLPDDGAQWGKFDYSSQEPRITLHFAYQRGISGAEEFVERYRRDAYFCQHQYAADILGQPRSATKGINLGITYGMGIDKLAWQLGVDNPTAVQARKDYKRAMPFVHRIADAFTEDCEKTGEARTILGRRSFLPKWLAYKALNRAVQGTGAELMKQAMVDVYEELGLAPLLTVHDETDYNIYEEDTASEIAEIMEHAIEMSVPQVVEPELGPNWGSLK